MSTFFRVQEKGISFESMKSWRSRHGEDEYVWPGVCASRRADGAEFGWPFGGVFEALEDDDEIVIFEGYQIMEIEDGYVAEPEREIARFAIGEWMRKLDDDSAYEYED